MDRDAIVAFMSKDFSRFFAQAKNEFRSMVADGDTVAVEHTLSAVLSNGRPYLNDYCLIYEVKDGRVSVICEYMDTRGGWVQVFGDDPPAALLRAGEV